MTDTELEKMWEEQLRKAEKWDTGVFLFFLFSGIAAVVGAWAWLTWSA